MAPRKSKPKAVGPTSQKSYDVLQNFLGETVLVFLDEHMITEDLEGNPFESPIVAEGILVDYDPNFVLLGNDEKTVFSAISRHKITKIDSLDAEQMKSLGRPDRKDFN